MSTMQYLCAECQKERKQFAEQGDKHSPGCAALWRLAFTKDEDAWRCIQSIFAPWVTRLCDAAVGKAPKISGLSRQDVADIVQDVWHNLWRYAVRNPVAAVDLMAGDDLSRVIGLIKTTVKNRVLELCRKPQGYTETWPDDDGQGEDDAEGGKHKEPQIDPPALEPVLDLLALLQRNIETMKEFIVAELIILQEMKPQDVLDLYPEEFTDLKEVNQTRQTLVRRIRNAVARQKPGNSASLEFRVTDVDEAHMNKFDLCPFDEGILIDYINGHVDPEIRAAIEQSPACRAAAAALQTEIAGWRPYLRQLFCPTSERLVAYQERRLAGTDYLILNKHVQQCPFCSAEIQMLTAVDAVPATTQPSLARRIFDLLFQPATTAPVPILGEGSYRTIERTPQIELLVRTSRTAGKQRNWMLFGRLRYESDQPVLQVESIVLKDIEDADAPELSTTVDEHGAFTVKGLDAGLYQIRILMAAEEFVVHEFKVGDDL